jgi:hypothetical protein
LLDVLYTSSVLTQRLYSFFSACASSRSAALWIISARAPSVDDGFRIRAQLPGKLPHTVRASERVVLLRQVFRPCLPVDHFSGIVSKRNHRKILSLRGERRKPRLRLNGCRLVGGRCFQQQDGLIGNFLRAGCERIRRFPY